MKKVNMIVDVARCHDCNNCFLSCKDEHWDNDHLPIAAAQPRFGQKWRDVLYVERGQYPLQDVCSLSYACMHCDDPACMKAAQNGAVYKREDGIVIIDPIKAKGQKQIADACPYKAIFWNEESQLPQKCTMCAHLLDSGEWKQPRCSFACPTGALTFLYASDEEIAKKAAAEGLEYFHPEYGTKPRIWYKNLYRFIKCHIAGSIELHDKKECADGAKVMLTNTATKQTWTAKADNYGDFKFDKLEANSGVYTVTAGYPGYQSLSKTVELKDSVNVGAFYLTANN